MEEAEIEELIEKKIIEKSINWIDVIFWAIVVFAILTWIFG